MTITATVTAGTTWSSTATVGATQSFVDDIAPSAPVDLTASAAAGGDTGFTLSWSAATDNVGVVGYDVYRSGTAAPIGSTTSTTFTDQDAAPRTAYTYSVVARDAAGLASPAATCVVDPGADTPAGSSPSPDPVAP